MNPAETEIDNGVDDNCDGRTDEGLRNACGTWVDGLVVHGTARIDVALETGCDALIGKGSSGTSSTSLIARAPSSLGRCPTAPRSFVAAMLTTVRSPRSW